jgi:hypothetical protein
MFKQAVQEAMMIAQANGFTCPPIQDAPYLKDLGWYMSNGCIGINVDRCGERVRDTVLHELGHRWHHTHTHSRLITRTFKELVPVSSYAPNTVEIVAEAFRLFMKGELGEPHATVLRQFGLKEPQDAYVCSDTCTCQLDSIRKTSDFPGPT